MINKLSAASSRLHAALDEYLGVCLEIQNAMEVDHSVTLIDLADHMSHEMTMVSSHESTFKKAKIAISRARNRSSILFINLLPVEILMQIFRLIVQSESHCANTKYTPHSTVKSYPKYPDLLTHVCSRWRNIMITCPAFWSHIDSNYWTSDSQCLFDRAKTYIARARERPLYIHHVFSGSHEYVWDTLRPIVDAAARAYAIEIEAYISSGVSWSPSFCDGIAKICLKNCTPGRLSRLTISAQRARPNSSISTNHLLNLRAEHVIACASITALCLKGFYLPWTSPAYHNLAELRLNPAGITTINEEQLMAILISSPGLQLLEFDIPITTKSNPSAASTTRPVHLDDLHILMTGKLALLPLITSGSKALNLTLLKSSEFPAKSKQVREFFARSNVMSICITEWNSYVELFDLLELAPHVWTAILNTSNYHSEIEEMPVPTLALHALIITNNIRVRLEDLHKFTEAFQVQELTLSMNQMIVHNNEPVHNGLSNTVQDTKAFESLLNICPRVNILSSVSALPGTTI
ncbi:hypothetical protein B0J17DRAFT_661108 [Rhizoctonia solani]|nr:hypothetical protein B0J17DRAFT_661108 [Rhizoctonia solani]